MKFLTSIYCLNLVIFPIHIALSSAGFCGTESVHDKNSYEHVDRHADRTHANKHMHRHDFKTLVDRFEDPERDKWQKPNLVIEKLGDISGKTVADIGAGTGYFAFRLAEKAKKVIAIDIDQRFLDYIESKNRSLDKRLPIETRLVPEDDPRILPSEVDLVIIVNTYHHIENRRVYLNKLRENLKSGTRLVIVDFKKKKLPVGPPMDIKLSSTVVAKELRQAGFEKISVDDLSLVYQYIVIAN